MFVSYAWGCISVVPIPNLSVHSATGEAGKVLTFKSLLRTGLFIKSLGYGELYPCLSKTSETQHGTTPPPYGLEVKHSITTIATTLFNTISIVRQAVAYFYHRRHISA